MNWRAFLGGLGGAAALPLGARAQQPDRMRRIGFLRAAAPPERELDAFMRALSERGYVQGRNFVLVPEWGDGNVARLPGLAVALVNQDVDVIVTEGTIVVRAAAAVTRTIPIVTTSAADPFMGGLIKTLARPGGNITGFASLEMDISSKVFEILKEIVPGLHRIAVLATRAIWAQFAPGQDQAAKALGIEYSYIDLPQPEAADAAMRQAIAGGGAGHCVTRQPTLLVCTKTSDYRYGS